MAIRDIFQAPLFIDKAMQSAGGYLGNLTKNFLFPPKKMQFPVNETQIATLMNTPSMQLARTLPSGEGETIPFNDATRAIAYGYKTGDKEWTRAGIEAQANLVSAVSGGGFQNVGKKISQAASKIAKQDVVTAADRLKDFLIEHLPKQGTLKSALDLKLADEADEYLKFLKETKNPTMNELNQGLEILRLQGKNVKPAQDAVLESSQIPKSGNVRFLKTPDGRFNGSVGANPLEHEARKYKTAEEFVKAVTEDRGGVGAGVEYSPAKRLVQTGINDTPITNFGFKPSDKITIYRGVDRASQTKIQAGDYVALSEDLAKSYTGGKVISEQVPASSVRVSSGDRLTAKDFKDPQNMHIEAVYNPTPPIPTSQLTDIWKKANQTQQKRKI